MPGDITESEVGTTESSNHPYDEHVYLMLHPSTRSKHRKRKRESTAKDTASDPLEDEEDEEAYSDLDDAELNQYVATDKEVQYLCFSFIYIYIII